MSAPGERYLAIEVEDVHKAFRLPSHRVDTLKERLLNPFGSIEYTSLHALRGVSFAVGRGEFLGVAGRNGSGKTTLLKLLASVYRPDRGRIRIAGTLAPFIELGVGFNPNLTARHNVLLNGVMMGLTPREARRRFDEVIDFAELQGFVELKLKNFSSGMSMRLAFAVMVQSDADVMLIDEVLAVGDASFGQKCIATFRRLRREGRTVLFVTHDMESMRSLCDRALLLEDGVIETAGQPDEVAERYYELNFAADLARPPDAGSGAATGAVARISDVWLEDTKGSRVRAFGHGARICVAAMIEADRDIEAPGFGFQVRSPEGAPLFGTPLPPPRIGGRRDRLAAGERVIVRATLANPFTPGTYVVNCSLSQRGNGFDIVDQLNPATEMVIWGMRRSAGYVEPAWDLEVEPAREAAVPRGATAE